MNNVFLYQNRTLEKVKFQDFKNISYQKAWDYQHELLSELVTRKRNNRKLPKEEQEETDALFVVL